MKSIYTDVGAKAFEEALNEELSRYRLITTEEPRYTPRGKLVLFLFRTYIPISGKIRQKIILQEKELEKYNTIKKLAKYLNKQIPTGVKKLRKI